MSNKIDKRDIKPCPFCGQPPSTLLNEDDNYACISCINPDCIFDLEVYGPFWEIVTAWQHRHTEASPEKEQK